MPHIVADGRQTTLTTEELDARIGFLDDAQILEINLADLHLSTSAEANAVYDRLYGELAATHRAQDGVLRWASLASPTLALRRVSAAICGTDLGAQLAFVRQAESHRRATVEALNRHMMEHAGDKGFAYMAGKDLWEQVPDFAGEQPGLGSLASSYWVELLSLAL